MGILYEAINDLSMKFTDGEDVKSGLEADVYFCPVSWMKTIAKPNPTNTAASLVEIKDNHVMNTGKKPILINCFFKKSGFKGTFEGEDLNKICKQGPAEFFIPSLTPEILGTVAAIKNYRGIVLMKRPGENEFMQIGSQGLPANLVSGDYDTGTGPTGSVGVKIAFEAYGTVPYYIYKGEIPSDKATAAAKAS